MLITRLPKSKRYHETLQLDKIVFSKKCVPFEKVIMKISLEVNTYTVKLFHRVYMFNQMKHWGHFTTSEYNFKHVFAGD